MTDEQIRQNADEYAKQFLEPYDEEYAPIKHVTAQMAYIAGAHSRDIEIGTLEGLLKINEHEIEQLRNPWISVEERLPDIGQKVITITNKGKLLLVARTTQPPHKEEGGWRWEHYVGKVTHWMPIPQLPIEERLIAGLQELNEHFKKGE